MCLKEKKKVPTLTKPVYKRLKVLGPKLFAPQLKQLELSFFFLFLFPFFHFNICHHSSKMSYFTVAASSVLRRQSTDGPV